MEPCVPLTPFRFYFGSKTQLKSQKRSSFLIQDEGTVWVNLQQACRNRRRVIALECGLNGFSLVLACSQKDYTSGLKDSWDTSCQSATRDVLGILEKSTWAKGKKVAKVVKEIRDGSGRKGGRSRHRRVGEREKSTIAVGLNGGRGKSNHSSLTVNGASWFIKSDVSVGPNTKKPQINT